MSNMTPQADAERFDFTACLPLLSVHAGCLLAFWTGVSPVALAVCLALVWIRGFGIAVGYHRCLAHGSFGTSRTLRFLLVLLGTTAAQLGPVWWVAHHRDHHRYADTERDAHSPAVKGGWRGFFWAHIGWLLCRKYNEPDLSNVPDLLALPEIRLLERYHALPPLVLLLALYGLGSLLAAYEPQLGTSGAQMVIWGFFVSTTLMYHGTFAVNSVGHTLGSRRFETEDESRNNWVLAMITMGEGFQNNHHRYPAAARAGLVWWEFDLCFQLLRGMAALGLVWDLREPDLRPARASAPATLAAQSTENASPSRP